jgi:hypothetical protein
VGTVRSGVPGSGKAAAGEPQSGDEPVDEPRTAASPEMPARTENGDREQSPRSVRPKHRKIRDVGGRLAAPWERVTALSGTGRQWYQQRSWLPGRLFAALTQLPALLAVAWLLPGVAMLLAGRLTPTPMVIIFVPLAIALCYFAMRQLPASWPKFGPGPDTLGAGVRAAAPKDNEREVPAWAVIATVAIAAGFAVWQGLERSQQLIVARDPGVNLQYAYWIAHHGAARIPVSSGDFGGAIGLNFASPGFLPSAHSLVPGAMAGLPLVLAGAFWLAGMSGALLTGPVLGGLAILSFAGLAGRLAGARWAPAAALVLSVALPQQYVSRTTFGEPLIQILLFGGLCLATDSLTLRRPGKVAWQAMTLAGFGGLAIGLTALVNVGSLGIVLPLFPVLALMFVARMPQSGPLAFGLLAGIGCGVAAGSMLARPYLSGLGAPLHDIGLAAAGFGIATALVAPLAFPSVRGVARRVVNWELPIMGLSGVTHRVALVRVLLEALAVLTPVAALVWFAIRPSVQVVRGATDPFVIRFVASLQRLERLPVNGHRQYYEQSLNWVIWYIGLPCLLLACIGAALLARRCLRALLRWRGAAPAARVWAMPLLVIGWSVIAVLWIPATLPDQPWASRRLVPVVLPGLVCLALWVCSRVRLRASEVGAGPVAGSLVSVCCVLALGLPAAVTTFDPGYQGAGNTKQLAVRGMAFKATYGGEQAAVAGLCSAIGPSASVIIVDRTTASSFTQVVRGMCGMPTARMDGAPASAIEQTVVAVERIGRRPVLLGASKKSVALVGTVPQLALNLSTWQDAHALTGPPASPWTLTYTVWMASPDGVTANPGASA